MSSSDKYGVLKPDCFERGNWRETLQTLGEEGEFVEIRLFNPVARHLVDMHPEFCWDVDDLSDWLALYTGKPAVIGVIRLCSWSYAELAKRKGATFQPATESIRGQAKIVRRVSNVIHTPTNEVENMILHSIFNEAPQIDTDSLSDLLSALSERVFNASLPQLAERFEQRARKTGAPSALSQIARQLKEQEPGSSKAKMLALNFVTLADSVNLIWSLHERQMLKEAACYPVSI